MPGLPIEVITVPLTGLQGKVDPKTAPLGVVTVAENCWASKRTAGGFELRKRFGFASKTRSIQGGGTLASGRTLGVLNDELVLCDSLKAYSLSVALDKWVPRGRAQHIACDIRTISGDQGPKKPNVASATAGGIAVYAISPTGLTPSESTPTTILVKDTATGEIIANSTGLAFMFRCRVVVVGSDFFIFCWNGANNIEAMKISGSTPTTIPTTTTLVANNINGGDGMFDVIVDAGNGRMVVAYQNTTPALTLKIWNANMTAGTAVANSVVPSGAIGFLNWDFTDGFGYVAVTTSSATRVLKFGVSDMTVPGGGDVSYEAVSGTNVTHIGGYRVGTTNNIQWTVGSGQTAKIRGAMKTDAGSVNLFDVMLSVGLASKPFKIGSLWYVVAAYQTTAQEFSTNPSQYGQRRTFLLELQENTTGGNATIGPAGYLMANDSAGTPRSGSCLPSVSVLSSTKVTFGAAALSSVTLPESTAQVSHWKVVDLTLDWSGAGLGKPVVYGGVLHLPGAAPRFYDGHFVAESGFWVYPEAPGISSQTTGGSLELTGTYQYCAVYARTDKAGRRWRSAVGPIAEVTLTGSNNKVVLSVPTLRVTESHQRYNLNPEVTAARIELYRTQADLQNFYLIAVIDNNPLTDAISYDDIADDDAIEVNEQLYTTGDVVDHIPPPAVKVFHRHAERLFAITGDQSIWHTNVMVEETGAEFSDEFRFTIEEGDGPPVAFASIDSTLAIFKAERTLLMSGAGPDDKGVGAFSRPQALQDDLGAAVAIGPGGPASVCEMSGGALVRSGKSWWLLGRDLGYQPMEAPAGFDALIPAFGAPLGGAPDKGRPILAIPTNDAALVYDWQLGQWMSWTGASSYLAGVCAVRWRGNLAILKNDGTVRVEVPGQFFDESSTAIGMTAEIAWLELNNARVYKALVTIEALATTSVTTTFYRNRDDATGSAKVNNVTTAWKEPLVHAPTSGDCAQGKLRIAESSATEGIRVSKLDLEVGLRPGAQKHRASAYAG